MTPTSLIIAEHGVYAVTAASVGEAAGYSRGIVNHQFGTRQALLAVVAETVQSRFDPNPDGRHGRQTRAVTGGPLSLVARSEPQNARVFQRLMTAAISGEESGLQAVFAQRDEHFRQHVADALADGQRDHSIRPDVDPPATAAAIVGQLRGIALQLQLAPDFLELDALLTDAGQLIDRGLQPST